MFVIRRTQVAAFSKAAFDDFEDRMLVHLRSLFPEETARMSEPELRSMIALGVKRAALWGLTREYDVCLYLHVMLALGPRFDEAPELTFAREILSRDRDPSSNIDFLHDRVFEPEEAVRERHHGGSEEGSGGSGHDPGRRRVHDRALHARADRRL